MVRVLVFILTALAIIFGLLLFDDMDIGLAVVAFVVWLAVLLAGLLLVFRSRRNRRVRRKRPFLRVRSLTRSEARREAPLFLPRR